MPAQTPIERVSLKTSLVDRYESQRCGGAYEAKSIKTGHGETMPIYDATGIGPSLVERMWTYPDFFIGQTRSDEQYNGRSRNIVNSMGFNNKKYKP